MRSTLDAKPSPWIEYRRLSVGAWALASAAGWARLYYNVSLIDCASKEALDDVLKALAAGHCIVARVSDHCVIVDERQRAAIARALGRRGHPYRITDLGPRGPERS